MPTVFLVLTGGYGNIGDAVIRRRAIEAFRGLGRIHAYVGNGPDSWIEQLGIDSGEDVLYRKRDYRRWVLALLRACSSKVLVFDPGEVLLTKDRAPKEAAFLALTIAARVSGARVVRLPRALREPAALPLRLHRIACRMSHVTLWRERSSLERIGVGSLVPDIAFGEHAGDAGADRPLLVVSMRAHRPMPDAAWMRGLAGAAAAQGLSVRVVSQVREDEPRSLDLAAAIEGAALEPWGDRSDSEQERRVRNLYRRSAIVVSDRLHVLVLAALDGAAIAEVAPAPSGKIASHFDTIGDGGVSLNSDGRSAEAVQAFLAERLRALEHTRQSIEVARRLLDDQLAAARDLVTR